LPREPKPNSTHWIGLDELCREETKAALEYWKSKCAGRAMPQPQDIKPQEIPRLLPYLCLVDVLENPRDYYHRIEGEAVRRATGASRARRRLSEFREYSAEAYELAMQRLNAVC